MKAQDGVHVGLNAHLLSRQLGYRRAGIHNYIHQLIQHLPGGDPPFRFTVFAGHPLSRVGGVPTTVDWQTACWSTERPWARVAWEQLVQPWALWRRRVDLVHGLAFVAPLLSRVPAVVTVHDLSFLRFPERFRPANRYYLSALTRLSCHQARRVIAVSQATADELTCLLGVSAGRIDVVPHGVDHRRFRPLPPHQVAAFRKEKGLPDRFVLFLGTLEPRKNLETLVTAFAQCAAVRQGVRLVIAGGKGWYYQEIYRCVEASGVGELACFAGFVPDAELPLWYNAAAVFVYPSLYEGFGMPLLEAMACGIPVIASDASCLPEVVGDAGLLAAADDARAFAHQLDRLLTEPDLRLELGQRGQRRAAAYTWEATATATLACYHRALQRDGGGNAR